MPASHATALVRSRQSQRYERTKTRRRRGNIAVLSAVVLVVFLFFLALTLDVGYLCVARTQCQRTADAAALAGAQRLLDDRRFAGNSEVLRVASSARQAAADTAAVNRICRSVPRLDLNSTNHPHGDIVFGRWNKNGTLSTVGDLLRQNAVHVRVNRTQANKSSIALFFARAVGVRSADISCEATAAFQDGIRGFRPTDHTGSTQLLPFAMHINAWDSLMAGHGPDDWDYDPETGQVQPGADGVPELLFYPNSPGSGNFGTLQFGDDNNATGDLIRQIRTGISASDLSQYGGQLTLDSGTDTVPVGGDPGVSSAIKHALADILGAPRAIPLYNGFSGSGDNAVYTIVGFAGIRIVDYWLDGNNPSEELLHRVILQPAYVIDDSAIPGRNEATSDFVYQRVTLVR